MTLIKSKEHSSAGPPPAALFEAITRIGSEAARAGVLIETGGLLPTIAGARVRVDAARIAVDHGPSSESQEVVGGYAIFEVASKQEAIDWATKFMAAHVEHWKGWEGETEVRQMMPTQAHTGTPGG